MRVMYAVKKVSYFESKTEFINSEVDMVKIKIGKGERKEVGKHVH